MISRGRCVLSWVGSNRICFLGGGMEKGILFLWGGSFYEIEGGGGECKGVADVGLVCSGGSVGKEVRVELFSSYVRHFVFFLSWDVTDSGCKDMYRSKEEVVMSMQVEFFSLCWLLLFVWREGSRKTWGGGKGGVVDAG